MDRFRYQILAPRMCLWMHRKSFTNQYRKWCTKAGYRFNEAKAASIYAHAAAQVNTLPMSDAIKRLVILAASQLNTIIETLSVIQNEMLTLASKLPEFPVVMKMFGVGPVLGPQLIAEIGDVRRFHHKQSLVALPVWMHLLVSLALSNRKTGIFLNVDLPGCENTFPNHVYYHSACTCRQSCISIS